MDERAERRYVLAALALLVVVGGVLAAVDYARRPAETPRLELMQRCFEEERGFPVLELPVDSPLADAAEGGLVTVIETNRVEIAIAGSEAEAERLAARASGQGVVERRVDTVVVWEREPSPTQLQALADCSY